MMKQTGSRLISRHNSNRAKDKTKDVFADHENELPAVHTQLFAAYQNSAEQRYFQFVTPNSAGSNHMQYSRSLKLALLREAIAGGSYRIDSRRIANKILRRENGLFS